MLVEAIASKITKKEAMKYILSKTPLMSKVAQFNKSAKDIHLEYIEFKILSYEVIIKEKQSVFFRYEKKKYNITMLVNTYNGYSESIEIIPNTSKKYIAKSFIKKSKVREEDIIEGVKTQIIYFLGENLKPEKIENLNIEDISVKEIRSIYKPYWVADFNGKTILMDA